MIGEVYQKEVLEPLKTRAIPSDSNIKKYGEHLEDPAVARVRHKQARLSNIYEQLGHLSFHRLKLLARLGIIPKELSNVYVPISTG